MTDSRSGFLKWNFPTFRGWSGNLGWPILLKELRADFRKNRFFMTHSICLTAIAIGILGKVWFQSQEAGVTSVQLGRELFNAFFMIQYFIVLVVFPAFTATAFTEERSRGSFDLLMTTDLRPAEIVLGKFQATSIYCLITVFATIPLLAVSTLFGGVQFEEILAAYGILIGLTVIMSMLGVFFSSCFKSNLPSTLAVYTVVLLVGIYTYFKWDDIAMGMEASGGETIVGLILNELRGFTGAEGAGVVVVAAAAGAPSLFEDSAIWGVLILGLFLFAYLFLLTTNRIRPASDDRASKLRALTMLFVFGWVAKGCLEAWWYSRQMNYDVVYTYIWTTFVLLFGVALLFATESLNLSRRLRAQFSRLRGLKYPLRIFTPGSFWGLMYLIVMLLFATAGLYFIWTQAAPNMETHLRDQPRELILTMPIYLFAFGSLGFFLASWGFTHGYNFLTVFFIFIITLLLPVIFQMANRPDSVFYCYYLSPITLYNSLNPEEIIAADEDGPKFVLFGGVPIILVAKYVFGGLGVAFLTAGSLFAKRENYPLARLQ